MTGKRAAFGAFKFTNALSNFSAAGGAIAKNANKPKVLIVNHGFPPFFNGGSEVYTQTMALEMLKSGMVAEVNIMARELDPFRPDFEIRRNVESSLPVHFLNYPREAPYFSPLSTGVDGAFRELLRELKPDVVHFHHLNHLSLNLPSIAKEETGSKVVYTLHDYWLMCPRGQFLMVGTAAEAPWRQCNKQENEKCAAYCYVNRYGTGDKANKPSELKYWTEWIGRRMKAVHGACESVDAFLAPSRYLQDKFINKFHLPANKVQLHAYGFDRARLKGRQRETSEGGGAPLVFAYIGRHQPAKGINLLIEAALKMISDEPALLGQFEVRIFGREELHMTKALQRQIDEALPGGAAARVFHWHPEYNNFNIVSSVFNKVDIIVVPSIWEENSPLVIHEAQQCRVPVITSEEGGMGELVKKEVNGLTFRHRDSGSLAAAMLQALKQPSKVISLGERGYIFSESGDVPCIVEDVKKTLELYKRLMKGVAMDEKTLGTPTGRLDGLPRPIAPLKAPWRITFDTNPDDCNFQCTMCEQHSEYSPHQKDRKAKGIRRRRMDIDLIERTLEDMAPLGTREAIPTTMGEPLMYKEFPKFIDLCSGSVKMNLTTNGSFFPPSGKTVSQWAELIAPVTVDVKISWNGSTQNTQQKIMKNSNLDTQKRNLKEFINVRDRVASEGGNYCSVTLQLTFMEQNLSEIPDIVRFAIECGCDRVKGHHLWAHFTEIEGEDLRRSKASIDRWNRIAAQCRDYASAHPLKNMKRLRLDNFFALDHSASAEQGDKITEQTNSPIHPEAVCPFLGKEAWVNHEGRFDPCCAPDEQRKSLGDFGNINEPGNSLMEIW
eukprot:CAMPEP_0172631388 /NCGR_PEP_ID=MMETSP1068-20121228/178885_1 /TAXON_ID=35684 /ORGANISM="Pseudopedinella elastica, Strain CCMP716" /LENGTH=833 /DNA_ID=CAMNT_0013442511 /DNA_START=201 /DNA_END=2699 /DNA_ORIENTATION=-